MSWLNDALSAVLPHDGYNSVGDAAKAFWMPQAYASEQNQKMTMMTNAQNRANIEYQNQMNLEQWRRENAYNDPVNQMQRMRSAGLNPGLMYGGSGSIATSAPSPMMQGAHDVAPQLAGYDSPLDKLLAIQQQQAMIKNIEANTNKVDSETKTEDMLREERYNALVESNRNMAKQTEEVAERIKAYADQHRLTEAQLDQLKFERVMEGKRYMLDYKRLKNDTKLSDKQIEKMNADIQKTLAEKKVTEREYQEMVWTYAIRKTGLANDVNLTKAQIDQAKATARKLGIEGDLDAPMAFTRRKMLSELEGGLIGASASYAVYDVIDNFGRFIH